jgi:hypothetical protein
MLQLSLPSDQLQEPNSIYQLNMSRKSIFYLDMDVGFGSGYAFVPACSWQD